MQNESAYLSLNLQLASKTQLYTMIEIIDQPIINPIVIGELELPNRIVMAPMTRGRVANAAMIPERMQAIYYGQRASAGLIITEGTWVNEQAIGFNNVPGIFTAAQADGWKAVTTEVHEKGGKIFLQLGHVGSLSHPDFFKGELPVAPSAVNPNSTSYPPTGPQPTTVPRALSIEEIKQTVQDYKKASQYAKDAGFDGVEIHAQHPSIISQFLSNRLNTRTDEYGGTLENKSRFLLEILNEVTAVWGPKRVSVKMIPYLSYAEIPGDSEENLETYTYVANRLNDYDLAFLHILNHADPAVNAEELAARNVFGHFRAVYHGVIMASGGFNQEKANELLNENSADMVSFGTLFIANPDLPERFKRNLPLNEGRPDSYMFGNEKGYTDYAFADQID